MSDKKQIYTKVTSGDGDGVPANAVEWALFSQDDKNVFVTVDGGKTCKVLSKEDMDAVMCSAIEGSSKANIRLVEDEVVSVVRLNPAINSTVARQGCAVGLGAY